MEIGVKSQAVPLAGIFASGTYFRVPAFQRSYAWDDSEALELLSDLREGLDLNIAHFIGTIVVVDDPETGAFEIVDGQQRLTTLTIIIAALRDLMNSKDAPRERLRAALSDDHPKRGTRWRLTLNEFDAPFFREAVQEAGATLLSDENTGGDATESRDRLTGNTTKLVQSLRNMPRKDMIRLADYVLDGCSLVMVEVADRNIAQRVFRVLNDRGKGASNHDITKNELFSAAGFSPKEINDYARSWSEYESRLRGKGMDDLLGFIRTIHDRKGNNKNPFLPGRQVKKTSIGRFDVRNFLESELPSYVEASETLNTNVIPGLKDPTGKIGASLRHLTMVDHLLWRPAALYFLMTRADDEDGARKFFPLLERLAWVMQLVVTDRGARDKRYRPVLDAIGNDRDLFDPEGPFFIDQAEGLKVFERLQGKFTAPGPRRNLMLRINAAMPAGEVVPAATDVSIEHVLPRVVEEGSHWAVVWPNSETRAQLCETIGNFVLLPRDLNTRVDRVDYHKKKKMYFEDGVGNEFALTRDILDIDTWTPDVVRNRTKRLANHLCQAWGLGSFT